MFIGRWRREISSEIRQVPKEVWVYLSDKSIGILPDAYLLNRIPSSDYKEIPIAIAFLVLLWNNRLKAVVDSKTAELNKTNNSLVEANELLKIHDKMHLI